MVPQLRPPLAQATRLEAVAVGVVVDPHGDGAEEEVRVQRDLAPGGSGEEVVRVAVGGQVGGHVGDAHGAEDAGFRGRVLQGALVVDAGERAVRLGGARRRDGGEVVVEADAELEAAAEQGGVGDAAHGAGQGRPVVLRIIAVPGCAEGLHPLAPQLLFAHDFPDEGLVAPQLPAELGDGVDFLLASPQRVAEGTHGAHDHAAVDAPRADVLEPPRRVDGP